MPILLDILLSQFYGKRSQFYSLFVIFIVIFTTLFQHAHGDEPAYNYIRGEIFGDELTVSMLPQHGKRHQPERPAGSMPRKPAGRSIEERLLHNW